MVQAIPRSKARLTERQQFWLDHLRVCREQGHTLRGYAKALGWFRPIWARANERASPSPIHQQAGSGAFPAAPRCAPRPAL